MLPNCERRRQSRKIPHFCGAREICEDIANRSLRTFSATSWIRAVTSWSVNIESRDNKTEKWMRLTSVRQWTIQKCKEVYCSSNRDLNYFENNLKTQSSTLRPIGLLKEILSAFRRMLNWGGMCKFVCNDKLQKAYKIIKSLEVKNFCMGKGLKWKFITEQSPLRGDFYEHLNRSRQDSPWKGVAIVFSNEYCFDFWLTSNVAWISDRSRFRIVIPWGATLDTCSLVTALGRLVFFTGYFSRKHFDS